MIVEITEEECEAAITALGYGEMRVRESIHCPYEIKSKKIEVMQTLARKLRQSKKESKQ
jgi:hypothetical protein